MFARTFLQLFLLTALVGQLCAAPLGDPLQVRHLTADSSAHSSGIYPRAKLLFHPITKEPGAVSTTANKAKQRVQTGVNKLLAPVKAGALAVKSGGQALREKGGKFAGTVKAAHAQALGAFKRPTRPEESEEGEEGEEEGEEPEEEEEE